MRIKDLQDKAHRLVAEARGLLDLAEREKRGLTTEEKARHDQLCSEAESTIADRDRLTAQEDLERRQIAEVESRRLGLPGAGGIDETRAAAAGLWFGGLVRGSQELMAKGLAQLGLSCAETRAAMQEDTAAEGGYVVPTPLAGEILAVVKNYGLTRRLARILPMSSKTLSVPDVATKPAVTIVAEEGTVQESEPTIGQNLLTAKKLIAYATISKELDADSIVPIGGMLVRLFAEAIAGLEDAEALEGDGTGTHFTGLKTALSGAGFEVSAAGATNLDPFINAMAQVASRSTLAMANGVWVFHPLAWMKISQLKTATEGIYYLNPTPSAETPLSLLGRPVFLSDKIVVTAATPDTASGYFGDWRQGMLLGERQSLFAFTDPYTLATSWQSRVYVGERAAISVALPEVFVEVTACACE